MAKQPCQHCGLPTWVPDPTDGDATSESRPVFCCTGCAFAHRLAAKPGAAGTLTPLQTAAWVTGFAIFNQAVFWVLAVLLREEGRASLSRAAGYASIGLGGLLWLVLVAALATGRRWSRMDLLVWGLTLAGVLLGLFTYSISCAMEATLGLLAWTLRGFLRTRK